MLFVSVIESTSSIKVTCLARVRGLLWFSKNRPKGPLLFDYSHMWVVPKHKGGKTPLSEGTCNRAGLGNPSKVPSLSKQYFECLYIKDANLNLPPAAAAPCPRSLPGLIRARITARSDHGGQTAGPTRVRAERLCRTRPWEPLPLPDTHHTRLSQCT